MAALAGRNGSKKAKLNDRLSYEFPTPKAPLCKGGCQKSMIFDWGIVGFRTTPPVKIEDFDHLPLHRGGLGAEKT